MGEGDLQLSGLLHLGALAVAFSVGYMGFDRIRAEPDNFGRELERIHREVETLLKGWKVEQGQKVKPIFNTFRVHILCFVGRIPIKLGFFRRCHHVFQRQFYVPLLGYFRYRTDRAVVSAMVLLSIGCYLAVSAATIWPMQLFKEQRVLEGLFVLFSAITVWIFFTAALTYRLRRVGPICKRFENYIKDQLRKNLTDAAHVFDQYRDQEPARSPIAGAAERPDAPRETGANRETGTS